MAGTIGKGEEVGGSRNWVDKGRASWVKGWQRAGWHTPEDGGGGRCRPGGTVHYEFKAKTLEVSSCDVQ